MIFLAILRCISTVISPLLELVLPVIPSEVITVIADGIRYMSNGVQYVVWLLWSPGVFSSGITFVASITALFYGVDLVWKAISLIKLRRGGN